MRLLLIGAFILVASVGTGQAQENESDRVVEMWTCTLKDGKSVEEIEAVYARWLRLLDEAGAGEVRSFLFTHLVGAQERQNESDVSRTFLYVDNFPNIASWGVAKQAEATAAGEGVLTSFQELSTCDSNALYRSRRQN